MSEVQVEQKTYQMPPQEGITIAHFLTVADVERSLRFYEKVFGGRVLSRGDSKGAPGYIQIANTWLLVNPGGGPTPDKPTVSVQGLVSLLAPTLSDAECRRRDLTWKYEVARPLGYRNSGRIDHSLRYSGHY
jgi:predicted enzyme related to lactoylglutathione lyase